ncbi:2,3,4,5-tetrahydropyridine-2,6-dicarboxylate N-succinyltransferase [Klebsiella grimontii]|uniref:2,3,4,5-tetrahydropyridine-2,6-dicarboxylate N-succinyltransferase n=1 Tax=Klebsiella grimontii TaxID=2058152 RepID=A0A7H4P9W7_9ENTR|nr:2,3,4,5-tetrahydropyridine-2,6-dicarboxylate N-succinyltransferase [Klebsiella grimontii]
MQQLQNVIESAFERRADITPGKRGYRDPRSG